MKNTI